MPTGPEGGLAPPAAAALATLVTSVADAVYAVDAAGRVRYANPAALRILGYEDAQDELLGSRSHATIHHTKPDGTPYPEADCPLLKPRATGEVVRVQEDWFVRRDGTLVPVAYSSAPVDARDGRGAVVVFRDTTAERAAGELRASRTRIVTAMQEERRRIGRDLHDGAQQHLVNVLLSLELFESSTADGAAAKELLEQARSEAREALDSLRELSAGLLPSILTHRGLRGAIESLTARAPLPVELEIADERFAPQTEAAAYFFVSEALTNVFKHARASVAQVRAARRGDRLIIEVQDDGIGGATRRPGGGLLGLEDRVSALDGTLAIVAAQPSGTLLRVVLPARSQDQPISQPRAT